MRLLALKGPLKGKQYAFSSLHINAGKAEYNDLVIPDDTVSRHHFSITRDIKGFVLRDLGSTNGTFLDGAKIREGYIRPGSILSAGGTRFRFSIGETTKDPRLYNGESYGPMVFESMLMRKIAGAAKEIALSDMPFLILGECGTGKKTFCRAVHEGSTRNDHPLVFLKAGDNAPPSGKKKSDPDILNLLRSARNGTLVMEDPWDMETEKQILLINSFERMSLEAGHPPIRLAAVSTRKLFPEVAKGRLDKQMASYLGSMSISLPALREHPEDIGILFSHFAGDPGKDHLGDLPLFLLDLFNNFYWPGNIGELKLMIETGFHGVSRKEQLSTLPHFDEGLSFREHKKRWVNNFEKSFLQWLYNRCEGNVSKAARKASMDRKHLNKLFKRHGIKI